MKELTAGFFDNAVLLSKSEVREFLHRFENYAKTLPQLDIPVKHHWSYKVYGREIKIDKGSIIVGKIHRYRTMNVISSGEVSVLSIDGVIRVKAPFTFVSSAGAKRMIFAHEDSTWTTFHGTEETNLENIEKEFIATDYDEFEGVKCLG